MPDSECELHREIVIESLRAVSSSALFAFSGGLMAFFTLLLSTESVSLLGTNIGADKVGPIALMAVVLGFARIAQSLTCLTQLLLWKKQYSGLNNTIAFLRFYPAIINPFSISLISPYLYVGAIGLAWSSPIAAITVWNLGGEGYRASLLFIVALVGLVLVVDLLRRVYSIYKIAGVSMPARGLVILAVVLGIATFLPFGLLKVNG